MNGILFFWLLYYKCDILCVCCYPQDCESELKQLKKIPPETISNIVENKKKLDLARAESAEMKTSLDQKSAEVMKLRKRWMTGVRTMVANVDDKFRDALE